MREGVFQPRHLNVVKKMIPVSTKETGRVTKNSKTSPTFVDIGKIHQTNASSVITNTTQQRTQNKKKKKKKKKKKRKKEKKKKKKENLH